eukprot:c15915_g1_i2.p1 GENE.c15915_g1_i2~~c15915_g1_i2.p1  ORF type:complete len:812 (-),score=171.34 c15915_g1_i2:65-2500(-)
MASGGTAFVTEAAKLRHDLTEGTEYEKAKARALLQDSDSEDEPVVPPTASVSDPQPDQPSQQADAVEANSPQPDIAVPQPEPEPETVSAANNDEISHEDPELVTPEAPVEDGSTQQPVAEVSTEAPPENELEKLAPASAHDSPKASPEPEPEHLSEHESQDVDEPAESKPTQPDDAEAIPAQSPVAQDEEQGETIVLDSPHEAEVPNDTEVDQDLDESVQAPPVVEEVPPEVLAQQWLERYHELRAQWKAAYDTPTEGDAAEGEAKHQPDAREYPLPPNRYRELVARREKFFENKALEDEWRQIENATQPIRVPGYISLIRSALDLGVPEPDASSGVLPFTLAREAAVALLVFVLNDANQDRTDAQLVEEFNQPAVRTLVEAAQCSDSVLGSEAARVLCKLTQYPVMHPVLCECGIVQLLVPLAAVDALVDLLPSKLLNISREAGAALKYLAVNPLCTVKVSEEYAFEHLCVLATCSDLVRRAYAKDTLTAVLSNFYCVAKLLEKGHFSLLVALAYSADSGIRVNAEEMLQGVFDSKLYVKHFRPTTDMTALLRLLSHPNPSLVLSVHQLVTALISNSSTAPAFVVEEYGFVPVLLDIACNESVANATRHQALLALQGIASHKEGACRLAGRGVLLLSQHLLCELSHPSLCTTAHRILSNMSRFEEFQESFSRHSLRFMLQSVELPPQTSQQATVNAVVAETLKRLSASATSHRALDESGALLTLIRMATQSQSAPYAAPALEALLAVSRNVTMHGRLRETECVDAVCRSYKRKGATKGGVFSDNSTANELLDLLDTNHRIRDKNIRGVWG